MPPSARSTPRMHACMYVCICYAPAGQVGLCRPQPDRHLRLGCRHLRHHPIAICRMHGHAPTPGGLLQRRRARRRQGLVANCLRLCHVAISLRLCHVGHRDGPGRPAVGAAAASGFPQCADHDHGRLLPPGTAGRMAGRRGLTREQGPGTREPGITCRPSRLIPPRLHGITEIAWHHGDCRCRQPGLECIERRVWHSRGSSVWHIWSLAWSLLPRPRCGFFVGGRG